MARGDVAAEHEQGQRAVEEAVTEDDSYIYHDDPTFETSDTSMLMSTYTEDRLDHLGTKLEPSGWRERLRRIPGATAVGKWVKGPEPPRIYKIEPLFPPMQHLPLDILDRYAPQKIHRFWLLVMFYFIWVSTFVDILFRSALTSDIPGYGSPTRLDCEATYWRKKNDCGINGDQCRPFANSSLAFRCPASCAAAQLWDIRSVGDQEVNYRPLVVGGPKDQSDPITSSVYRGDSFICGSAIHAGFITDKYGGCGVLHLIGEQATYPSTKAHGISSIGFDGYFPQSFTFEAGSAVQCRDPRMTLLIVNIVFTTILCIFVTSPLIFYCSMFAGLFLHVGLVSDPPSLTDYYSLISAGSGNLLPAAFCAVVIYQTSVQRSLTGLTAQIEKAVFWLVPAWIGALNNYTFDRWIPIQRLTPHDLNRQPGAIPALIFIVCVILFIALGQAWAFRVEGRMPKYLGIYGTLTLSLLTLVAVPGMNVRLHHYIIALLLLPGTSFQNRTSLFYQGLLVGLFINGTARWGFASLLETPSFIVGGGPLGSLLPAVTAPMIANTNISFALSLPSGPDAKGRVYDGISVLINDVERFRKFSDRDIDYGEGTSVGWDDGRLNWTWTRSHEDAPNYFRFAYTSGTQTWDYTKAGTWLANGTWVQMEEDLRKREWDLEKLD